MGPSGQSHAQAYGTRGISCGNTKYLVPASARDVHHATLLGAYLQANAFIQQRASIARLRISPTIPFIFVARPFIAALQSFLMFSESKYCLLDGKEKRITFFEVFVSFWH